MKSTIHHLPLSEFRANAASAIALVGRGATVRLLRHGKAVADLVPVAPDARREPEDGAAEAFSPTMGLPGRSAVQVLLAEREGANW